ncbi:cell wall hydrolase [Sphingomonas sp. Leaf17]|uniref:cell wall hydrolase n=1 Tax=Sphingomonas sp. Leaf17 TaxID=1735683 RepID=UPI001F3D7EB5|nr:cell wall hydrolase [Sphingomonas sp. Leaf17]
MTLSIAGLVATSTPGWASELDRTPVTASSTVSAPFNAGPGAAVPVSTPVTPAPAPLQMVQSLPATMPVEAPTTDTEDFSSLADAVAAQDGAVADEALRCLAGAIYFESKGEPLAGQLAVAEVIINRAKSGRFADNICGVVKQRGQFSFVRGGQMPSIDATRAAYRTALAVAKVAIADAWDSPAPKALFFHAARVRPSWGLTKIAAIGNHIFYR